METTENTAEGGRGARTSVRTARAASGALGRTRLKQSGPLFYYRVLEIDEAFVADADCYSDDDRTEFARGKRWAYMVGIEIECQTATNWAQRTIVGRSYLFGVDTLNDPTDEYITEALTAELTADAELDMRYLLAALKEG